VCDAAAVALFELTASRQLSMFINSVNALTQFLWSACRLMRSIMNRIPVVVQLFSVAERWILLSAGAHPQTVVAEVVIVFADFACLQLAPRASGRAWLCRLGAGT
jgi:hypothetical protein